MINPDTIFIIRTNKENLFSKLFLRKARPVKMKIEETVRKELAGTVLSEERLKDCEEAFSKVKML